MELDSSIHALQSMARANTDQLGSSCHSKTPLPKVTLEDRAWMVGSVGGRADQEQGSAFPQALQGLL